MAVWRLAVVVIRAGKSAPLSPGDSAETLGLVLGWSGVVRRVRRGVGGAVGAEREDDLHAAARGNLEVHPAHQGDAAAIGD